MTPPQSSTFNLQSSIGALAPLPFPRVLQIALRGIRIRLGRSLVTLSGVVLGIAFLVSSLTTQLIDRAVGTERELRRTVNLMETVLRAEIGAPENKIIAIVACGGLSPPEQQFVASLAKSRPSALRGLNVTAPDVTPADAATLGASASAILVLGTAPRCDQSPLTLTSGMQSPLLLDSRTDRTFPEPLLPSIRRIAFFNAEPDRAERLARNARAEHFRLLWIVLISMAVTMTGVANALLMSVTERFREIGTIKCLGGLSRFIRTLFLIESALIGFAGSLIGALTGAGLTLLVYSLTYSFTAVFSALAYGWLLLIIATASVIGTILAMLAALYPAHTASRMLPAAALRSTV